MRCEAAKSAAITLILWTTPIATRCRLIEPRAPEPWGGEELWDGGLQQSRIDGVAQAAQALIDQAYPGGVPEGVNIQTAAWPDSFNIGGTAYTGVPDATTAAPTTAWWTPSQSNPVPDTTAATTSASSSETTSSETTSSESSTSSSSTRSSRTSSRTSTSASRTSSSTPTATSDRNRDRQNDNDRNIAIILGVLLILPAIALAAAIFFALWRRKRQTGSYFKAARDCEIAPTPTTSAVMWGDAAGGAVSPGLNGTEPTVTVGSRSWFGGTGRNSLRANYPEMTENAEKLPEPVDAHTALISQREIATLSSPALLAAARGHSRLQKSNSSQSPQTPQRGVPEIIDPTGLLQPHELMGDSLAAINEMDAGMHSPTSTLSPRNMRRLSSFPFVLGAGVPGGVRSNWDYAAKVLTRSSSADTKGTISASELDGESSVKGMTTASELDGETTSLRQRQASLERSAANPLIMAQFAEAESEFHTDPATRVDVSRSDSGNAGPSEMDGESPTRRVSTWRELQRSTFTVADLEQEIQGINAIFGSIESESELETGSETDDSSKILRGEVPGSTMSPTSTIAFTEIPCSSVDDDDSASQTALTSTQGSDSDSVDEESIGFISTSRGTSPASPEIKTTELVLPPRPPMPVECKDKSTASISPVSLNTPSTVRSLPVSPLPPPGMSDRDYILNRARYQSPKTSPKTSIEMSPPLPSTSNTNKPAWAPAGAYATAPIWRKKQRPAPLYPDFLSPMTTPNPTPPDSGSKPGLASNNPFNPLLLRKSRPQPLTPDWLPKALRAGRQDSIPEEEEEDLSSGGSDDNREMEVKSRERQNTHSAYQPTRDDGGSGNGNGLAAVAKGLEHYPSWSKVSGFGFDDGKETVQQGAGDDGSGR